MHNQNIRIIIFVYCIFRDKTTMIKRVMKKTLLYNSQYLNHFHNLYIVHSYLYRSVPEGQIHIKNYDRFYLFATFFCHYVSYSYSEMLTHGKSCFLFLCKMLCH